MFNWPGPIHEGNGEAAIIVDERANAAQREALLRILSGQDTEPGATIFQVFATTLEKVHEPIFSEIDFEVDVDGRRARLIVPGMIETRGEPILNPVTGAEHRVRIDMSAGLNTAGGDGARLVQDPRPIALRAGRLLRPVLPNCISARAASCADCHDRQRA